MSRWAKVRTKRVEALTRRVMSIAFTRGRTARTVANVARTDDGVVAAACADDDTGRIMMLLLLLVMMSMLKMLLG